jgi:hypothetical protein
MVPQLVGKDPSVALRIHGLQSCPWFKHVPEEQIKIFIDQFKIANVPAKAGAILTLKLQLCFPEASQFHGRNE